MNIAIITTNFYRPLGGTKFEGLSEVFLQNGHSVHIIGQDCPPGSIVKNNNLFFHPVRIPQPPIGALTVRIFTSIAGQTAIRRLDNLIDIYIVDDYHGLFLDKITRKRIIAFSPVTYATIIRKMDIIPPKERNFYIDSLQYCVFPFMKNIQRQVCRNASRIITCCEESYKSLNEDYSIDKNRVSIIPAGVDVIKFNPSCDALRWRKKLGIINRKVILSIGKPFFIKGISHLLRAFRNVSEAHSDAILVIVGQKNRFYDNKIFNLTSSLGIRDKVIFTGVCPYEEIPYLIAAADIFAHLSISEGTPRVVLEAMACGKAVLATDVGGVREVISEGSDGLLVEVMNVSETEKKLNILLEDAGLRRSLGNSARLKVEKNFSWDIIGRRILNLCESLA